MGVLRERRTTPRSNNSPNCKVKSKLPITVPFENIAKRSLRRNVGAHPASEGDCFRESKHHAMVELTRSRGDVRGRSSQVEVRRSHRCLLGHRHSRLRRLPKRRRLQALRLRRRLRRRGSPLARLLSVCDLLPPAAAARREDKAGAARLFRAGLVGVRPVSTTSISTASASTHSAPSAEPSSDPSPSLTTAATTDSASSPSTASSRRPELCGEPPS